MGSGRKGINGVVATLSAIFLIALLAGYLIEATLPVSTTPVTLKDCNSIDGITRTVDCGTAPLQAAAASTGVQSASGLVSNNQSQVKFNTITDRADTLERHPVVMENSSSRNPTYQELMAFLKCDDTVKNKYDYPNYTCANFVVELEHKAENKGIRCGYAGINFQGKETGHALNVFQTTDSGLVYVDLTCGKMIISKNLRQGMKYYNMGVIDSLKIYW